MEDAPELEVASYDGNRWLNMQRLNCHRSFPNAHHDASQGHYKSISPGLAYTQVSTSAKETGLLD